MGIASSEHVSYDVTSLFTNVPVKETIDYIIDEIYNKKKLKEICSKLIMKRLLKKLTSDCVFSFNNKLYKQVEGCAMGNPLSVVLANIHMSRMEREIVNPNNPILYARYVDDIFCRKKKNETDTLFESMNRHHPKIKLTIENNLNNISGYRFNIKRWDI